MRIIANTTSRIQRISYSGQREVLLDSTVAEISKMKNEPEWMLNIRLKAYEYFMQRPMPLWGGDLSKIDFDNIYYYAKPTDKMGTDWKDVPENIRKTFDKLGIPEAERKFLGGVGAQYESEVVYHSLREDLAKKGVVFLDMDSALKEYPDIVKRYFGTIIPPNDNKFASLNTAVWSGGSFVYIPSGVKVEVPLQAYFRINSQNVGQFERTLIICEPGSEVHYIEGCTAPVYSSESLHSAVVEIIARKGAKVRYTTIQNWSKDVYNLVTKRAYAYEDATVEWVDGNLGSRLTMKYPAIYLVGPERRVKLFRLRTLERISIKTRARRFTTSLLTPHRESRANRSAKTAEGRLTAECSTSQRACRE